MDLFYKRRPGWLVDSWWLVIYFYIAAFVYKEIEKGRGKREGERGEGEGEVGGWWQYVSWTFAGVQLSWFVSLWQEILMIKVWAPGTVLIQINQEPDGFFTSL